MGQRIYSCPNLEFAKGFVAGIDFANDSSLRVKSCTMDSRGIFRLVMEDSDGDIHDYHPTENNPVSISMEVLRDT